MRMDGTSKPASSSRRTKWIIGCVSLLALAGIAYGIYHPAKPKPRDFGPNISEADRRGIRNDMTKMAKEVAGLSDDQIKKMEAVWKEPPKSREEARARFQKMQEIMTPEQRAKMRAAGPMMGMAMFNRRMEQMRGKMSPQEFDAYKAKRLKQMQDRMKNGGFPGGPGHRPGGGPGGPGGFPPR